MMHDQAAYVIALYIRLSLEDSKVESMSIENQKHALHRFVDEMEDVRNAEILEFIDNGYSGTNFERPAVQELLDLVREGKIHCIIVKDFTRFGRNSIEVGYFMERVFPLYGIRFISVNDDFDSNQYQGDTGGLNVAFKYLIAEFYSRDLSVKSKSAKYVKFRRGEYQSTICPYGYQKSPDGRMEPDPETAPNVQLIFQLAREGNGAQQIAKELHRRGIPTPGEYKAAKGIANHDVSRSGGFWSLSTVQRILTDERYTGTYIMGRRTVKEVGSHQSRPRDESQWIKIPNHHPSVIDKELFQQVQSQISHSKSVKKNVNRYPLRGKVFCGCCGHALAKTSNKNHDFHCRHTLADESAPCYGLRIREAELETMLYEILSKQARIILNLSDSASPGKLDAELAKQTEYAGQIQAYQDQKRGLYERLLLKEISLEDYRAGQKEIDSELDRLKQLHTVLATRTAQMQMDGDARDARKKLAREISVAGGLTETLADTLIERVCVYPGNQIEVVWKMKDFCVDVA